MALIGGALLCALAEYLVLMAFGLLIDGLIRKLKARRLLDLLEDRLEAKLDL